MKNAIVEGKHAKDCYAVEAVRKGAWSTCWGPMAWREEHGAPRFWGTPSGKRKKRNTVRWLRFVCNCTHCPARLLVREDAIIEALGIEP